MEWIEPQSTSDHHQIEVDEMSPLGGHQISDCTKLVVDENGASTAVDWPPMEWAPSKDGEEPSFHEAVPKDGP